VSAHNSTQTLMTLAERTEEDNGTGVDELTDMTAHTDQCFFNDALSTAEVT